MATTIVTYNINGLRAALKKGLAEWVGSFMPDILCLQETKGGREVIDISALEDLGYVGSWHPAEKKGYSGVLTLSKKTPDLVEEGIGKDWIDREGRVLRTDFGPLTLLNCYFPSGTSSEERHQVKMDYLAEFFPWVMELKKSRKHIIIVGDYNIVHTEKDIHNPRRKDNPSGYRPEERVLMTEWLESGFIDAFRYKNPDKIAFSWWSLRNRARESNKGWRIDYQSISTELQDKILFADLLTDVVHSDHCPLKVTLDIDL